MIEREDNIFIEVNSLTEVKEQAFEIEKTSDSYPIPNYDSWRDLVSISY